MTDKEKLDAVRAEIHRLVDVRGYDREMANDLFVFMDSLPNEPVSEDLEKEVNKYFHALYSGWTDEQRKEDFLVEELCTNVARHFANWQKEKDGQYFASQTIETLDNSYALGKKDMKEQMMKDAFECKVKVDAGNYPYIPQMELYDYDKDIPLAKEGDKYKVILIKEN